MHGLFRWSSKWWPGAILLVVFWGFAAWTSTEPVEGHLAARANAAIKDAVLDKKRITVAGRDVTFAAEAFSNSGRLAALEAVEAVPGIRIVNDEARLVPEAKPFVWSAERDVVRLLAEGLSSKEIAEALSLTPKTVDTYRQNIMAKLGLKNVAGVVRYAVKHQIVSID